jgi:hemolysin activation/secretion protein
MRKLLLLAMASVALFAVSCQEKPAEQQQPAQEQQQPAGEQQQPAGEQQQPAGEQQQQQPADEKK